MKKSVILFFAFYLSTTHLSAQKEGIVDVQNWDFMVRTTARLQEIAIRFHVPESEIRKYSNVQGKTVYPGKVLTIPVKVRPASWDPTKFNPNKPFLSSEDAPPQMEYEWNTDSLDPLVKDDFIRISAIQGDSIQSEKMTKHVSKIERKIAVLNNSLDSMKKAEFSFQYDEKDMNSVLKRMEQARQRYYAQGPLGKEIDSLADIRTKLNEEINRLRNTLSEYEYLTENAYFFEKNKEGERDMMDRLNNRPGDQLIAESNLLKKANLEKRKKTKKKKKKKHEEVEATEIDQLQSRDILPSVEVVTAAKMDSAKEVTPTDNHIETVTPITHSDTLSKEINNRLNDTLSSSKPVAAIPSSTSTNPVKPSDNVTTDQKLLSTKISIAQQPNKLTPSAVEKPATNSTHSNPLEKNSSTAEMNPSTVTKEQKSVDVAVKNNTPKPSTTLEEETKAIVTQTPETVITNTKTKETTNVENTIVAAKIDTKTVTPADSKTAPSTVDVKLQNKPLEPTVAEHLNNNSTEQTPSTTENTIEKVDSRIENQTEVRNENQLSNKETNSNPTSQNDVAPISKTENDVTPKSGKEANVTPKSKVESPKRNTNTSVDLATSSTVKPLREKDLANREEIKKAIARKTLVKEEDPLDQYSESPDFAFRGLQFQEMPVAKSKNGPKYLVAVDAITALKAKIWVEQFKLEMKNLDFKKAESCLRKSLETNPNNAESWTFHAEMLSAAGRAQEALKEYMIATAIDPAYSRAYLKAGMLYENSNNIENAYDYYSRAIDADSTFYKAYLFRAALSVKQEDRKSAIEDYTALIAVNKNFSLAYKERGILRMVERNYAGAVEDFSSYLEIEDPNGEIFYRRGIAKVYTGKIIDGCNDFNNAVQLKFPDAEKAIKKYCD